MQQNQLKKECEFLIGKQSMEQLKTLREIFRLSNTDPVVIAGPCVVENEQMLDTVAKELAQNGVKFLRGGAYKPRTSPYSFQGLGIEGLKILKSVGHRYNMYVVSEVTDTRLVELMVSYVDVLQIGSRNMQNFELLKEVGRSGHPVILKRGMSATIDEFKLAAEYIALEGNRNIIMCERGIKTFETQTRNTLDVACIPIIKNETQLPIIVDLSHSLGRKDIITDIAKAVMALGADGIMVEVHPSPDQALSDRDQQLTLDEFKNLFDVVKICKSNLQ